MGREGQWAWLLLACGLGMAGSWPALAQPGPRITAWRAAEGLPQSAVIGVTLGPHGGIVTTHDTSLPVASNDGFRITTVSNTIGAPSRVHVSRSGQLWCANPAGLLEQTGDGWNQHSLPEIAAEYRLSPFRSVRPIPLLPLDRNRVLVVLPDRILEYDATERRSTVIRLAADGGIGRFNDLCRARDDGAWISGSQGLLRISGPARQIRRESPMEEFVVPPSLEVGDLGRPFEDRFGAVVMAGETGRNRDRIVVRYSAGNWQRWTIPGQNIRQAWPGADGELWGHTASAVVRLEPEGERLRTRTMLQVGRVADVAVEIFGVAWIATSEGLYRIAALPWRPVVGLERDVGSMFAVASDRRGRVVAASAHGYHWLDGDTWRSGALRLAAAEDQRHPSEAIFPLPDGGILVRRATGTERGGTDGRLIELPPELARGVPVGTLPDGRVIFFLGRDGGAELVAYDGRVAGAFAALPALLATNGPPAFVVQARTGELWVGSMSGLMVRRGDLWEGGLGQQSPREESLADETALVALERADGRILVGGEDSLREFDGRGWKLLKRDFDRVHGLHLTKDGSLWVASGNGLHRYREGYWFTMGEEEGMPAGAVFGVFEDGSGRLWAATAGGLVTFDTRADPDAPRAAIAGADTPDRAGDQRALFVVGGEDRWRYAPAGRLMFSARLDNNPWSTWRPSGSMQFTDLTAGTHRFQVRAMDPGQNTQGGATELEFAVALPWFRDPRLVFTSAGVAVLLVALGAQAAIGYRRLKRSYAEVGRQVAERTAALERANAELLHSQKMRALGTLAAGVAHDFNSLLSIIRGSAQLIETHLDDHEKARLRVQRIKTAVDQGAGLVKAMLGYSRRPSAQPVELDVVDLIQRAVRLVDESLQERIEVVIATPDLPRVPGSPEMLQQILLNLIQNADEAVEHRGRVWIEVEAVEEGPLAAVLTPTPAEGYVVLRVGDDGAGISPEHLSRIFEPFFTTKGFSSRRGTGLGLLMVYEFAKELGAGISVESEVGRGSRFAIFLPVRPKPGPSSPAVSG